MNKTITAPEQSGELLRAGSAITVIGNAQIENFIDGVKQPVIKVDGFKRIGPFNTDVRLLISAFSGDVVYSDSIDADDLQADVLASQESRAPFNAIHVGDSVAYRNDINGGNGLDWVLVGTQNSHHGMTGQFSFLNSAIDHPFNIVGNYAVAGSRSDETLSQLESAIASGVKIEYVILSTGTNDQSVSGYTSQITVENIAATISLAKTIPTLVGVLLFNVEPSDTRTASGVIQAHATNDLLYATFARDPLIEFFEFNKFTEDFGAGLGHWRAGYSDGGAHPATYEAVYMAVAPKISALRDKYAYASARKYLYQGYFDSYQGANSPAKPFSDGFNILANFQSACEGSGTATPLSAAIINGTPPQGWVLSASGAGLTVTCTQEPRADGVGNWFVMDIAVVSGSAQYIQMSYQSDSRITNGKFYELFTDVEILSNPTVLSEVRGEIGAANGSLSSCRDGDSSNITANSPQPVVGKRLLNPPRLLSKAGDAFRVFPIRITCSGVTGTARIRVGAIAVREYSNAID